MDIQEHTIQHNNASNSYLNDVAIIRPILIVLLVFYHAFAPYSGAWTTIDGFPDVEAYWWLDKLSYAFMLETFVFISGYVFGYQVRTKGEYKLKAKNLFVGKFKRLIIPSMVFSLLYILLFQDISHPLIKTIYDIIAGVAHMWFLPMLLWCFIGVWIIEHYNLRSHIVIPGLLLCSICSFLPLPFQMGISMYYMLFFYTGYIIQRKAIKLDFIFKPFYIIILTVSFIILFPILTSIQQDIKSEMLLSKQVDFADYQLVRKSVGLALINVTKIIYSFVGLVMLFVTVNTILKTNAKQLPVWIIRIGSLCMGVYLFQQFILIGLYNCSLLPSMLGPYVLPWAGFLIALVCSLILSYLFRLTKFGRFLIG